MHCNDPGWNDGFGKALADDDKCPDAAEGDVGLPPDARCGGPDWCESIRPLPAPLVSADVRQALLLVFRGEQTPLLLTAQTPDEWAYEVALRIAAEMLRPEARHDAPQAKQADSTLWLAEPSEMASV